MISQYIKLLLAALLLSVSTAHAQTKATLLKGRTDVVRITENQEYAWFSEGVTAYTPDAQVSQALQKAWTPELQVLAFCGSWCPDTRRELPRLYRALQEAEIPKQEVDLYFLDRRFRSGTDVEQQYKVQAVPTFVVLRDGKEIGRIVVEPGQSLEADLLHIIQP